jgi:hypothetical protein
MVIGAPFSMIDTVKNNLFIVMRKDFGIEEIVTLKRDACYRPDRRLL